MGDHLDRKRKFWEISTLDARRRLIYDAALNPIDKRILLMHHVEFVLFKRIAYELNMDISTVGRRYKKALRLLRLD